jgi:transcriptional regulator with XRE-family HTH domain
MSYGTSNPVRYFGQQVRRARRAAGWTLTEFGQRIGYDPGQISRIENGKRPPTELFAQMCDQAFPDRDGWFGEFYAESRTWIATPPWFRGWVEHEQHAATLRIWQLGVLSGLLQTEQYARAILTVEPGVTEDQVSERLPLGWPARRSWPGMTLRLPGSWWMRPRCAAASAQRTSWPGSWPTSGASRGCRMSLSRWCRASRTRGCSAGSRSPSAPRTSKPRWRARCSRTLRSLPGCSPVSIRSGTRRSGGQNPWP